MELSRVHDHERTDAKVKPLVQFLIVMTVAVLGSFAFTTVLFEFLTQRGVAKYPPASPVKIQNELPPEPRVQVVPGLDLRELRIVESERFDGYGWVDENNGIVHIPVDKAIDVLLEKGLPVRDQAAEGGE